MTSPSDGQLMAQVCQQDQAAFNHLVRRHLAPLMGYANRLCGDASRAEDLVQETWLRVWLHATQYRQDRGAFSTWLFTILQRQFIDHQRKFGKETFGAERDLGHACRLPDEAAGPAQLLFQAREQQAFKRALATLPEHQRWALLLSHQQGFSNEAGAQILGVSRRAFESLLARGRRALRLERFEATSGTKVQPRDGGT